MNFLTILFPCCGILIALTAIPLVLGKVPPNMFYGVRTPRTMSDRDVWYKANAYGGRALLVAGLIAALGSIALTRVGLDRNAYSLANVAALLLPVLIALTVTLAYIRRLP